MIQPESVSYYNLFEIMELMEKRGLMKEDDFWADYVLEWGVKNDTIFHLGFEYYSGTDKEQIFSEYFNELKEILELPIECEGIMVEVSW